MTGDYWTDKAFVPTPAPPFDSDRVTARITWDDVVRVFQAMMDQPYQPYVDPRPLPQSVVDACPPNAPLQ